MACVKCGNSTESDKTLCEKCSAEADGLFQSKKGQKKPKKQKTVVISLVSVFIVLIGVVTVSKLFFNRDFMELIQGKTKYAQNIELATAKSSAKQIVSGLDKGVGMFKIYNNQKAMDSTLQFNTKVEDQFLKDMKLPQEASASVQQTVKYLNSLKISSKIFFDENGTQTSFTVTDPSALKLTVDSLMYNDGKTYVHIPELLGKYLLVGNQAAPKINPYNLSNLKYDSAKLQTSLEKLADIYVNSLSTAEMKAENHQSITVDGTTVQGQKLTASMTAAQTAAMVKTIAEAAKSDNDLYAFVSDNYGLFSAIAGKPNSSEKLTKESYGKLIDSLLAKLDLEKEGVTFSAISYLSQNGDLLAHSYESQTKTDKARLNYLITDKKYAVEFLVNQKDGFTFTNTKAGDGSGKLQMKIKNEQEPKNIGMNVDYSGCKTVAFLGSNAMVGKYVFSLYDPDHEIDKYIQKASLPEVFNKLAQSTLTVENVTDGDKLNSNTWLSVPEIMSVSVTEKMSVASSGTSMQSQPEPSQVLDISKDESGEAMNELLIGGIQFLSKTLEKDPELAAVLSGYGLSKEQLGMLAAYAQG